MKRSADDFDFIRNRLEELKREARPADDDPLPPIGPCKHDHGWQYIGGQMYKCKACKLEQEASSLTPEMYCEPAETDYGIRI